MREIKFRAWHEKAEEYCEGSIANMFNWLEDGQPVVIEQYTGLKDANGVEIYEGDIVTSEEYPFYSDGLLNYVGVVGIDEDGVYYDLKVVSDRVAGRACGGNLSELEGREVIGNIHQNPELLSQQEAE